jgi:NifU-like protein involved in Fe-S cluster formation
MTELTDLYSDRILALAAAIPHGKRLAAPHATASAHSKLCGSTVTVDLEMADGRISAIGQTVKACMLGQASASVVAREAIGSAPAEIREVREVMRRMLKDNGPPPTGRWADLGCLQPVKDHKGRHASVLLIFDAIDRAAAEIEAKAGASA